MIFLAYDILTGTAYQNARYENEKERRHLIDQAKNDARNNPGANVWIAEVTDQGIHAEPVGGI